LHKVNGNDGVRSGTALIHQSCSNWTIIGTLFYPLRYLLIGVYSMLLKALNIHSKCFMLAYF